MALVPVTREFFRDKRYRLPDNWQFARQDAVAPVILQELPSLLPHMPIAFVNHDDQFVLVAVLGLAGQSNSFVSPEGIWLVDYRPLCYQFHPFSIRRADKSNHILCVEESCVVDPEDSGKPFFDVDLKPTMQVQSILESLGQFELNRERTSALCKLLDEFGLLEEWPLKIRHVSSGGERDLGGLFRINRKSFDNLKADQLGKLHKSGSLLLIYAHFFSVRNLQKLGGGIGPQEPVRPYQASAMKGTGVEQADLDFFSLDESRISLEDL